jgi:MFS family permease
MLGAALMVLAALALMLAMSWGGTRFGWLSPQILSLLVASAVLWLLFGLRIAAAPEPFIPLSILKEPTVRAVSASGFFTVGVYLGLTTFLPVHFELVLGFSPSGSGTALIVWLAAITIGSFCAGRLMVMAARYKWVPLLGIALAIVMAAAFALKPTGLTLLEVSVLLFAGGMGIGAMFPVTTTIVQNSVAPHQLGTATGALNFARQLGGTIIVAAFGTILLGGIDSGGRGLTLEMLRGGAGLVGADFAGVFRLMFVAAAVLLVAGFAAVLAIEERPLRGRESAAAE